MQRTATSKRLRFDRYHNNEPLEKQRRDSISLVSTSAPKGFQWLKKLWTLSYTCTPSFVSKGSLTALPCVGCLCGGGLSGYDLSCLLSPQLGRQVGSVLVQYSAYDTCVALQLGLLADAALSSRMIPTDVATRGLRR